MPRFRKQFSTLLAHGFAEIARVTTDNRLLLAPGTTPGDLPGREGALVRQSLSRGDIMLDSTTPLARAA